MSEEIIKVLDNIGQKFGIAIDWTSENVLPYIQDLMHRVALNSIIGNIVGLIVGIIFLAIGIGILIYGFKQKKKDKYFIVIRYIESYLIIFFSFGRFEKRKQTNNLNGI